MATRVALLRSINVGKPRRVAMADLRNLLEDLRNLLKGLGFADARSLLQGGNLVFRSDARAGASLE